MSFYLKYRPQKVAELDMAVARNALGDILRSGRFAHAYLLTGPKGTGKTSSARILAKVLNCEDNVTVLSKLKNKELLEGNSEKLVEPCGNCSSCRAITSGSSLAVMEMDAASNRGIDDVRQLKERIGLAPAQGLFTVYVIDEVHMLTTEAFNALLKTLEEPPSHAVFVLCTTETHKIPDTVKSRCTTLTFKKATSDEIVHSLKKAVEGERLKIEPGVLEAISQRVDGSFRDGMKILEQLSGQASELSLKMVDDLTGFSDDYDVTRLVENLFDRNVASSLAYINEREQMGVDWHVLGKRLLENLRIKMIEASQAEVDKLAECLRMAEIFSKATIEAKQALVPQLPLELAVVDWCLQDTGSKTSGESIKSNAASLVASKSTVHNQPTGNKPNQPDDPINLSAKSVYARNQGTQVNPSIVDLTKTTVVEPILNDQQGNSAITIDEVQAKWSEIMIGARPFNHSLEALLRAARPQKVESNWLILEVFYSFHKEQLEQERYVKIMEQVISKVCGKQLRLRFVLATGVAPVPKQSNVTGKLADERVAELAEEIFG